MKIFVEIFHKLNLNRQRQDLAREFDELTERLDESFVATAAQVTLHG